MSDKIQVPNQKEVNKYIDIVLKVLPVPMFIGSVICLFNIFSEPNAINMITFISTALFEGLSIYVSCFVKSFGKDLAAKVTKESPLMKVWLSKHTHYLILAISICLIAGIQSLIYTLCCVIGSLISLCKVAKEVLGKRMGDDMKSTIDSLCDPIIKSDFLKKIRACLEILLCPYLFFYALFNLNPLAFLVFLINFFFNILFSLETNKTHEWVYQQLNSQITDFAKKNEASFGKHILKGIEMIRKVDDFGKKMYPRSLGKQKDE